MDSFNLNTLLHRNYDFETLLPDGTVYRGKAVREIPIRIPRIQRDYAEGREVDSIMRKRRNLLNDMLDVIYGAKTGLSFDFVYGYIMSQGKVINNTSWQNKQWHSTLFFDPLDGQQRLTTLFLLHWLFGRNDTIKNKAGESLFIYQTRDTSEEFCHWLVKQDAKAIITEWESGVEKAQKINEDNRAKWRSEKNDVGMIDQIANRLRFPLVPVPSLLDYLQSLDTFKWDWHDDPNIHSMIIVLESTRNLIHERGLSYDTGIANNVNLDNISFMLLDNLACDGDQLFEKMNARGKPLTSFEVLKSSLEEEMEHQCLPKSNSTLTNDWRKAIDIDWIDFCWDYANIGINPEASTVRSVESTLEKLLIRMAEKSFYLTDIQSTRTPSAQPDAVDYAYLLSLAVEGHKDYKDSVIERYFDYARYERAVNNPNLSKFNFKIIFEDIQNLIYKDQNGKWCDASILIPHLNRDNTRTLLDEFLLYPTHNIRVMMYAMLAYLRIVSADIIAKSTVEESNFKDWMRFVRNVYNADNKTARLDNFSDVKAAINAVDKWLDIYKNKYSARNAQDILRLINIDIPSMTLGQERARLEEEAIKAGLRLNGTPGVTGSIWETSILKAEDNYYLWGQIIAPLSWSAKSNSYDKNEFDIYTNLLDKWFGEGTYENQPTDALLVQTMLCYTDYRHNMKSDQSNGGTLGSLGLLNNHRDHSWKRYLRDFDSSSGLYGSLFKRVLDKWRNYPQLPIEDFLRQEITANKGKFTIHDWQYYIVNVPARELMKLLWYTTSGRYVYSIPSGHAYLFKSNTFRTANRYELLTCYLAYNASLLGQGVSIGYPVHTSDKDGAHVDFTLSNGDMIRLSVKNGNLYDISHQAAGASDWNVLHAGISVSSVETELKVLKVIQHL